MSVFCFGKTSMVKTKKKEEMLKAKNNNDCEKEPKILERNTNTETTKQMV